ncbi:hypothetical protein KOI35_28305 [Actinoplanes bogorensis]|uniref:Uncharacterized protein n=1 Tax=Paractinoplanes bogorensis TaxID=1610840 RepID=A0ABS5YVD9_9ACTN|nr:hypothetical protein [Actinoplanes bogorensis]MBU2667421.1 hypothetical protein [Actinoplanes bogorensis]
MGTVTPVAVAGRCHARGCDRKRCYASQKLAVRELRYIQLRRERHNPYFPRAVYFCPRHDGYHLTSQVRSTVSAGHYRTAAG